MKKPIKKRPRDISQLAASIVAEATGEDQPQEELEELVEKEKNPAAVALGRLGGLKGGKARFDKLTPERRKEIARIAAAKRWKNKS
jgi:hypothetical protein